MGFANAFLKPSDMSPEFSDLFWGLIEYRAVVNALDLPNRVGVHAWIETINPQIERHGRAQVAVECAQSRLKITAAVERRKFCLEFSRTPPHCAYKPQQFVAALNDLSASR